MAEQPAVNERGLVGAVVVEDQVYRQFSRYFLSMWSRKVRNSVERVASVQLADDPAAGHVRAAKSDVVPCRR